MESGDISDAQISASSHYRDYSAKKARLNYKGCWAAAKNNI